jgi:hypothetical protein
MAQLATAGDESGFKGQPGTAWAVPTADGLGSPSVAGYNSG